MEGEKNDLQTEDQLHHQQENNGKLDELAETQQNAEKANPEEAKRCKQLEEMQHDKGTPEENTPSTTEKTDGPEGAQQHKEKPDQPEGTRKKKRWMFKRKKKNLSNGKIEQSNINNIKLEVFRQEENVLAVDGGSTVQKKGKPLKSVETQGNKDSPDGTENGKMKDKSNGETSKLVKHMKQRQKGKKIKASAGTKIDTIKENVGEAIGIMKNETMKEKLGVHNKGWKTERTKDKLGGLIFMCSPKTKPDCFRYSVMGVTMSKKDLVQRIKPGLKLFLYDFDQKLLYGIYKASSSGGMKLEPAAFGGAFPVQVRFEVYKDCIPLPECVFRKAIMENYNEKQKFNTELTFEQMKKLSSLFRPLAVGSNSNAHIRHSAAKRGIDPKVYRGAREHQTLPSRPRSDKDGHTYGDKIREARREIFHTESFLSEKEYRTYGLQVRRRSRSPPRHIGSTLAPRHDRERDVHPRYPVSGYWDATPPRFTSVRHDLPLLNRRDDRPYRQGGRQELALPVCRDPVVLDEKRYLTRDPVAHPHSRPHLHPSSRHHYSYPSDSLSADPYRPAIKRDEVPASGPYYSLDSRRVMYLPEADPFQRREQEVPLFATSAMSDYTQGYVHQEASRHDPAFTPVSSRYSFAGSSYR